MSRSIAVIAVAIAAVIGVGFMVYSKQGSKSNVLNEVVAQTPANPPHANSTPNEPAAQTSNPAAQTKPLCTLTTVQSPGVLGVNLGLTPEQVLALFPGSSEDSELKSELAGPVSPIGVSGFVIRPDKFQSKAKFAGIKQITFNLLDGRVSSFSASYSGPQWKHVDEFVAKFAGDSKLPAVDAWEAYVGLDTQLKTLKCDGFEVSVFAGGEGGNLNYVQMKDLAAEREVRDRRAKARQKKASEAKP